MNADSGDEIAYLLTEIPDCSETFAAEAQQLVLTGVKLHVFSLIPRGESTALEAAAAAAIPLTCIPRLTAPSATPSTRFAVGRLASLAALHFRLLCRRTRAYLATLAAVASMCWKSRSAPSSRQTNELVEDLLLAVEIAAQILDAGTVRHVHGYEGDRTSTRAWLVSRLTGVSFSFTAVSSHLPDSELERTVLERKLVASVFVAARCDAARKRLSQVFPEAGAIYTVYRGVDIRYFSPRPASQGLSAPVILSVGRFEENSGFEYLIAACAQLKAAGTDCYCWLVGPDGAQSGAVRHAIETLGVSDRVSTCGSVTPIQLRHLLSHASVFALPGVQLPDRECLPEGVAEAMAMGVPVVSTASGIIPEFIEHRRTGILLGDRDSRALARVLQALLNSEALRRRLGHSGRQKAHQAFDVRVTTALMKTLFDTFVPDATTTPDTGDVLAPPQRHLPHAELGPRRERLPRTNTVAHGDSSPPRAVPAG